MDGTRTKGVGDVERDVWSGTESSRDASEVRESRRTFSDDWVSAKQKLREWKKATKKEYKTCLSYFITFKSILNCLDHIIVVA